MMDMCNYCPSRERCDDSRILEYECMRSRQVDEVSINTIKSPKYAKWLINCDGYYPYCSNCKSEPPGRVMTDFCPICGADMRGKKK